MWPSDCSQVRWSPRSTQAAAAAGQDLRALGLSARLLAAAAGPPMAGAGLPVAAATASGIAQVPADGSPAAATCPVSVDGTTRGTLSPGRWPPCQPIATVPATSRKARTAVNRYLAVAMEQTYTNGPVTAAGAPTDGIPGLYRPGEPDGIPGPYPPGEPGVKPVHAGLGMKPAFS